MLDGIPHMDRADIVHTLRQFPRRVAAERMCHYWRHLHQNVRTATPLFEILDARTDVDLADLAWRMSPPMTWPTWDGVDGNGWLGANRAFRHRLEFLPSQVERLLRGSGAVLHLPGPPSGLVALRVVDSSIELIAKVDGLMIETLRGRARVLVAAELPELVASAAVGRPVTDVVDHPCLGGTEWPIVTIDAFRHRRGTCTRITFETGRAAWRLRWPVVG